MNNAMTNPQESPRIPHDTFAARLVLIRHELELTVDEISQRCGIASATWSTWERGTSPRDKAVVCKKIADALDYDQNWLIWGGFPLPAEVALELIPGGRQITDQPTLPFRSLTSVF